MPPALRAPGRRCRRAPDQDTCPPPVNADNRSTTVWSSVSPFALTVGTWMARSVPLLLMGLLTLLLLLLLLRAPGGEALLSGAVRHGRIAVLVFATILLGSWSGDRAWRAAVSQPVALVDVDAVGTLMSDPCRSAGDARW